MRRDLRPLRPGDEITAELKILTERRKDLSCDRTRAINRVRGLLTGIFPALERELDLTSTGPLVLLTGYRDPAAIRRIGRHGWRRGCAPGTSAAPRTWPGRPAVPAPASTPCCPARPSPHP